jgi:class 3 adenylate cyclase
MFLDIDVRAILPTIHVPTLVLATMMFTDIVGSTERAAELGDGTPAGRRRRWRPWARAVYMSGVQLCGTVPLGFLSG